jgi:hypothetical protein
MSTCARRGRRRTPSRWHPKTAKHYAGLYDLHIAPRLGGCKLGELSAEMISRWQAERIAAGAGREAVLQALMLLGSILQRAVEGEWIARNPARIVRKVNRAPRREVRPLAPVTVEKLRGAAGSVTRCSSQSWRTPGCGRRRRWRCAGATFVTARSSLSAPCRSVS